MAHTQSLVHHNGWQRRPQPPFGARSGALSSEGMHARATGLSTTKLYIISYMAVPPPRRPAPQQASKQLLIRRSKKFDHKNYLRPNKIHEHVARAAADPATATAAANAATAANAAGSASRDLHAASIRIWSGRRSLRRARRQLPSSSADEKAYGAHAQVA